jgi:hypothetical protein
MKDYIIPFLTSFGSGICILLMDKLIPKGFVPSEMLNLMIKKNKNGFYRAIEKHFECIWNSSEIILDDQTDKSKILEIEAS